MYVENCLRCGFCCHAIFDALDTRPLQQDGSIIANIMDEFPYKKTENGYCEMFTGSGCKVYDHRPKMCDSRVLTSLLGMNNGEKEEFYRIQGELCRDRAKKERERRKKADDEKGS